MAVRVLVLEDDPNLRSVLLQVLTAQGYEAVGTERGEDAVQLAKDRPFDLIVADIRTDGMDGLEAISQARQHQPNLGTLVVSGFASLEETSRAQRLKVGGFLKKPFKIGAFMAEIQRLLQNMAQDRRAEDSAGQVQDWLGWLSEQFLRLAGQSLAPGLQRLERLVYLMGTQLGMPPADCSTASLSTCLAVLLEAGHIRKPENLRTLESLPPLLQILQNAGEGGLVRFCLAVWHRQPGLKELPPAPEGAWEERIPAAYAALAVNPHALQWESDTPRRPNAEQKKAERGLLSLGRTLENSGNASAAWKAYEELAALTADQPNYLTQALLGQARLARRNRRPDLVAQKVDQALEQVGRLTASAAAKTLLDGVLELSRSQEEWRTPLNHERLLQARGAFRESQDELGRAVTDVVLADAGHAEPWDRAVLARPEFAAEMEEYLDYTVGALVRLAQKAEQEELLRTAIQLANQDVVVFERLLKACGLESPLLQKAMGSPDLVFPEPVAALLERLPELKWVPLSRQKVLAGAAPLRVYSLGVPHVRVEDRRIPDPHWKSPRVRILLAFLASRWGEPIPDETIVEEFWPDELERGMRNLYWATSMLRSGLRELGLNGDMVIRSSQTLRLDPDAPHWHDLAEFQSRHEAGWACLRAGRMEEASQAFREMAELHQGPYLDGCYMDWAIRKRTGVLQQLLESLVALATHSLKEKRYQDALETGRQILAYEADHQDAHRFVMRGYLGLGDAARALDQYRRCERVLREEHGVEPNIELVKVYHRARLGMGDE